MIYITLLINLALFTPQGHTIQAAEWEALDYETATLHLAECLETLEYAKAAHNVTGECLVIPYDGDL